MVLVGGLTPFSAAGAHACACMQQALPASQLRPVLCYHVLCCVGVSIQVCFNKDVHEHKPAAHVVFMLA